MLKRRSFRRTVCKKYWKSSKIFRRPPFKARTFFCERRFFESASSARARFDSALDLVV
jgi:hypothetical protein